jgi:hypothetical protein
MSENHVVEKHATPFQDPLIRPDVNLQFLGGLVLVALPVVLLFMVFSKEPTHQNQPVFKPVSVNSVARP